MQLWLTVNGEKRQEDNTGLMLFRIPRILSDVTRVMRLMRDDIVLTGTPKGVGSVVPGDIIEAGVRVQGKDLEKGRIRVKVQESKDEFVWDATK